jgi:hypothetical protein
VYPAGRHVGHDQSAYLAARRSILGLKAPTMRGGSGSGLGSQRASITR